MKNKTYYIQVLAKIKLLLKKYWKNMERGTEDTDELRDDLLNDIDNIMEKIKIPSKNLVIEKLEKEN